MANDNLLTCRHNRKHFIKSGQWVGAQAGAGREHIYVCKDCGQLQIFVNKNGVSMNIDFHIHDREVIESMLKWVEFVEANK